MRVSPSMRMSETTNGSNASTGLARLASRINAARRFIFFVTPISFLWRAASFGPRFCCRRRTRKQGSECNSSPKLHSDPCFFSRLRDEAQDVVVEREAHQAGQHGQAHVLSRGHRLLADRAALHGFDKVIQEVSPVQDRDRQQV